MLPTEPITRCHCGVEVEEFSLRFRFVLIDGVRYKTHEEWELPCGHNIYVTDPNQWTQNGSLSVVLDVNHVPVLAFNEDPADQWESLSEDPQLKEDSDSGE